jgi:glutamate--cysteine ligase catalytic subunit
VLEILQGKGSFRGLVPIILAYLDVIGTDSLTMRTVSTYLDFIVARAAGELLTPAAWMRKYIRSHPEYKHDGAVSERIAADLMAKCHRIGQGLEHEPELHGNFHIEPVHAKDAYSALLLSDVPLERSTSSMGNIMGAAVEKYAQRSRLMAQRRQLHDDLSRQKEELERQGEAMRATEAKLHAVEAELATFQQNSPGQQRLGARGAPPGRSLLGKRS